MVMYQAIPEFGRGANNLISERAADFFGSRCKYESPELHFQSELLVRSLLPRDRF